ncbi:hypothetical protein, partial [Nocardia colli]|uniref:hypothetical protein n=1 Tax=Nocardia colli TaxID=2545717 RepID=UPI001CC58BE0
MDVIVGPSAVFFENGVDLGRCGDSGFGDLGRWNAQAFHEQCEASSGYDLEPGDSSCQRQVRLAVVLFDVGDSRFEPADAVVDVDGCHCCPLAPRTIDAERLSNATD